ncbi:Hypothetical predicted protein [Olea europaea subsp. europaea]|uniref:Rhodopsin n=1 Tax=Olea europaea subsp. europaea TaxID=158383 RepID=A0A8S0T3P5_OLEEU|nr:Hypothetical predicted protein [Olea europaea subsp. europaea]
MVAYLLVDTVPPLLSHGEVVSTHLGVGLDLFHVRGRVGPCEPKCYPPEGYPKDAYPPAGYPPQQGYPPQGYPPQYAPQYAAPPPQQQSSGGTGFMEGCQMSSLRTIVNVRIW